MSKAKYKQILDERMKEARKGGSTFSEDDVAIITIDLSKEDDRKLLQGYVEAHNKGEKNAKGSFNDYLQALHPEIPKGKVVVAEIKGNNDGICLGKISEDMKPPFQAYSLRRRQYIDINRTIDINGADFTGCRLVQVDFYGTVQNVSLRDCVFEELTFTRPKLESVDFRGTKLKKRSFEDMYAGGEVKDIALGFDNPTAVQRLDLFRVDDVSAKWDIYNEDKVLAELKVGKEKALKSFYSKMGWKSWAKSFAFELSETQQKELKAIEEPWNNKIKERKRILRKQGKFAVKFQTPLLDPTYTPKQSVQRADAIKVLLQVTRRDLEEYLAGDKALSLNDFIAKKRQDEIDEIQIDNPARQVVPIATIRKGEDISGMNFAGCDLRGVNFSYCDATGSKFDRALLDGSCLEGAVLNKASFKEALMNDCNMIGMKANGADFTKAVMIRSQLACSECRKAHFDEAVLCSSDLTMADLEGAVIAESNATKADMEKVNMRYVDAKHAILREAILTEAILDHANFSGAHLEEASLIGASACEANFEGAFMDKIHAQRADFRKTFMQDVSAIGADFTEADFTELKRATQANFSHAIFDGAKIISANFKEAILNDVSAVGTNFYNACLEAVQAERIDLREAIMKKVDARRANFEGAMMQKAQAFEANFEDACLEKAKLEGSIFTGANFTGASLKGSDVRGACFMYANLEKANVEDILYDARTLLIDANLKGIIGDHKTVEALKNLRKEQAAQIGTLFGASRYARCKTEDNTNDRYKCQQLGALVLSAAVGGAGYTLAGPLAGIGAGLLIALISEGVLESIKEHSFADIGYLNNSLGDRLAEVGAIAMAAGVEAGHGAIDGAVAGLICSSAGVATGTVSTILGVGTGLVGLKYAYEGHKTGSLRKKIIGWTLTAIGTISTLLGISSLSASFSTIAYATIGGAALRGFGGMASAASKLWSYEKDEDGKKVSGSSPEEIYREEIESAKRLVQKLWPPTIRKILLGCTLAATAIGVTFAAVPFIPFLGGIAIMELITLASALPAAGLSGFVVGYVYDKAITDAIFKINPATYLLNKGLESANTLKEKGSKALAHIQEKGISGLTQDAIELAGTAKNATQDMIGTAIDKGSQSLSKLREKGIRGVVQDAVELADTTQKATRKMTSSAAKKGRKVATKLKETGKAVGKKAQNTIKSIIEKGKERANTSKAKSEELRKSAALTEQGEKDKRS